MIATANNPNSHSNTSQVSIAGAIHHLTESHVCPQTFPDAHPSPGLSCHWGPAHLMLTICLDRLREHEKERWAPDCRENLLDGEHHGPGPRGLASAGAPRGR